jgi:hypothetical protein
MVFITGFGQMCNNILQFGHFYAWGKENQVKTIAMRFCYKYSFFKINNQNGYNWGTYLFAKYGAKMHWFPRITFDDENSLTEMQMEKLKNSKFILAEGWFMRDYDVFLKHRNEIADLFSFNKKVTSKVNTFFSTLPSADLTLGIHVRRGDYDHWQGGNYFYTDDEYISFISSFINLFPDKNLRILISTNDKTIDVERYKSGMGASVHFLKGTAGEDLCALSRCDYLIGPPSTFSLVAAFYHDLPLYWVFDKNETIGLTSFQKFDYLFRNII